MSILLGPYDIGFTAPKQEPKQKNLTRRRTVSTSFEQVRHERIHLHADAHVGPKSKSFAHDMETLPKLDLQNKHLYILIVKQSRLSNSSKIL